jgi:hypothetical protein
LQTTTSPTLAYFRRLLPGMLIKRITLAPLLSATVSLV